MRVCHFSTYTHGGAAFAARRLHEGLLTCGIDSRFVHGEDRSLIDDPTFQKLVTKQPSKHPLMVHYRRWVTRRARTDYRKHLVDRPPEFEGFSAARLFERTPFDFQQLDTDLVHLHWVSHLFDYVSFFGSIPLATPIFWTLHDMNTLTGGCHYHNGCQRFQRGCGHCPQVANACEDDVSADSFRYKQQALARRNLHIVTPSIWLSELAKQSYVLPLRTTFRVIPYGLNTTAYSPIRKADAKRQLGIEPKQRVILFGAEQLTNRRKGFAFLVDAIAKLSRTENTICLLFGEGDLGAFADRLPGLRQTGYLQTDAEKRMVYSAADCFAMPSLEDNQPQTGLEAMACGTPVVAFAAGGIPEDVIDNRTGLLAKVGDTQQLSVNLQTLIDRPALVERLGRKAREHIVERHDLKRQAQEYVEHYHAVTGLTVNKDLGPVRRAA
jgi:glycosyltransferase involved in cell wall biosynthesis